VDFGSAPGVEVTNEFADEVESGDAIFVGHDVSKTGEGVFEAEVGLSEIRRKLLLIASFRTSGRDQGWFADPKVSFPHGGPVQLSEAPDGEPAVLHAVPHAQARGEPEVPVELAEA